MKKLVITIIVVTLSVASLFAFSLLNKSDEIGEITIIVIDEIGDTISSNPYNFTESDTLFSILDDNFELGCADSSYQVTTNCEPLMFSSRVIMKIDTLETDWNNNYIGIYENGTYSTLGIDSMSLNDGDIFMFEYKEIGDDE